MSSVRLIVENPSPALVDIIKAAVKYTKDKVKIAKSNSNEKRIKIIKEGEEELQKACKNGTSKLYNSIEELEKDI